MNFSNQQVDLITQAVLQELRSRGAATAVVPPSEPALPAAITQKVVTEDTLAAASAAGRTISVPAGAVITPSGHDYIRRNQVTIATGSASVRQQKSGTVIVVGDCSAAVSAAQTAEWASLSAGCEFDAAIQTMRKSNGPVVCCGGEPSIIACLLNRDTSRRTAILTQQTDLRQLQQLMNPDVICLDSRGWTFAELLRLLRQLTNSDSTAPETWNEISGGAR